MLRASAQWDVVGLLTTVTDEYERVAMHGIRRDVLHAQAAAVGLPLIEARQPLNADNAAYEAAFAAALETARAMAGVAAHRIRRSVSRRR